MRDLEYTNTFMGINTYSDFHPFWLVENFDSKLPYCRIVNSLKIHHRLILMKIVLKFPNFAEFWKFDGFRRIPKYNCPLLFHFRIWSSCEIILILLLTNQNSLFLNTTWNFWKSAVPRGTPDLSCGGSLPRFNAVKNGWSTWPNGISERSFDGSGLVLEARIL